MKNVSKFVEVASRSSRREFDYDFGYRLIHCHGISPTPLFNDRQFERFFRITRQYFEILLQELPKYSKMFDSNACVEFINPQVRLMAALKHLTYRATLYADSPYFEMIENTIRVGTEFFCKSILQTSLKDKYLRPMSRADARKVELLHCKLFCVRGCLGALDCIQWIWDNCSVAWHGVFKGYFK